METCAPATLFVNCSYIRFLAYTPIRTIMEVSRPYTGDD